MIAIKCNPSVGDHPFPSFVSAYHFLAEGFITYSGANNGENTLTEIAFICN